MSWEEYIEKNLVSKRFILAIAIIGNFVATGQGEALVGAVMGFYFGEKAATNATEVQG